MVLVEEIMRNWRQCCIFQLKTIIQKHKFPKCSKRVSKLFPFSSPGTLCNICLHENGESTLQPKETTLFDIVQSRDLLQTSTINHPLDAIIHLLIPSKSYLNDIALYVKQQLLSLFHHKGNIVLKAAERDCLDNLSLHLYGSCVTGLQLSTVESDIDLMIEPPSSVRVLKMVNHDSPLDVPSESDSDSDEELQNNQANNSSDDQRSNRIRSVVCQEFKKLLEQLVRAEKKFLSRPNIPALARQKSTLYIEFFAAGILKSCEDERNFPQTVGSSTSKSSKPSRQQTVHLSDGLPEIDLLKLVEKLVRKYGANYGITLTQWLHHIRVPLLSVQIQLPPDLNYPESPRVISSDLTLFKSLPLKNTAFICTYLQWDQTNKVKSLILLIKRFVQVNDIHGASKGYLSSYTWVMLVFHYLLRLRLIPALDDETNGVNPNNSNDSNKFQFSLQLCSSTILESISVFELLKFFFWYYTTQIDVYTNVVTLRGNGEV